MKRLLLSSFIVTFFLFFTISAYAGGALVITEPATKSTVSSPVKVCLKVHGFEVEPAKNGVNNGKGHHHLIVDSDLPIFLGQSVIPIATDKFHIHMGDGSTCKELKMTPGNHIIKALFAKGNHIPYTPPVTATIFITVE